MPCFVAKPALCMFNPLPTRRFPSVACEACSQGLALRKGHWTKETPATLWLRPQAARSGTQPPTRQTRDSHISRSGLGGRASMAESWSLPPLLPLRHPERLKKKKSWQSKIHSATKRQARHHLALCPPSVTTTGSRSPTSVPFSISFALTRASQRV